MLPGKPVSEEESQALEVLKQSAAMGNLDAIKMLRELNAATRYSQLIINMDDDEFTPQTFANRL